MQPHASSQEKVNTGACRLGWRTRTHPGAGRWKEARNGEMSEAPEDNFLSQNVKPCSASMENKVVASAVSDTQWTHGEM